MATVHFISHPTANPAALLLTLANLEQAAKFAAQALVAADSHTGTTYNLDALLDSIQRKADALRVINTARPDR